MNEPAYTYFDKDGKIQPGLNPVIEHGFIQVEPMKPVPPSVTFTACEDCARLVAEVDQWKSEAARLAKLVEDKVGFDRGYCCAVAEILRTHGENVIAKDVLRANEPNNWDNIDTQDLDIINQFKIRRTK